MGEVITSKVEYKQLINGKVTPSGNSAHIPFSKKFLGRLVYVLIPECEPIYKVLSKKQTEKLREALLEELTKGTGGMTEGYRREMLKELAETIRGNELTIKNITDVISHVQNNPKVKDIITKLKKAYNIE